MKGPKLRSKLLLAGIVILSIPWLGFKTLQIMKDFLIQGQAQSQLLIAESVATLLHNRRDLFSGVASSSGIPEIPLYQLENLIRIDGYREEWNSLYRQAKFYRGETHSARVLLGERDGYLYGLIKVRDTTPVTSNPSINELNRADQVRLRFLDNQQIQHRLVLSFEGNGKIAATRASEDWLYAIDEQPDLRVNAFVLQQLKGYTLEFSLPLSSLSQPAFLSIDILDVLMPTGPDSHLISTLGSSDQLAEFNTQLNPLLRRSAETGKILRSLDTQNVRIWVVDEFKRVRAVQGGLDINDDEQFDSEPITDRQITEESADLTLENVGQFITNMISNWLIGKGQVTVRHPSITTTIRDDRFLSQVLEGEPHYIEENGLVIAAYPIHSRGRILGAVLVEQSINQLLDNQRTSLARVVQLSLLTLFAVLLVLLLFAGRLTHRIRRLDLAAETAIDEAGRVQPDTVIKDKKSHDEIGDLARNIDTMLTRLYDHQQFLHNIPRTLRHEINNPLNTISTSLENLSNESKLRDAQQLGSAKRGLARISQMVQSLADAANLEQALVSELMEPLDLNGLTCSYLKNREKLLGLVCFRIRSAQKPLIINGSDLHIEQLLDKLIDNALDFYEQGSLIEVTLGAVKNLAAITIMNKGPSIREEDLPHIFQLMSSRRDSSPAKNSSHSHFGLGLYVAKTIVSHHRGAIRATNLKDHSGVKFTLTFPLAD